MGLYLRLMERDYERIGRMENFGPEHISMLVLATIMVIGIIYLARKDRINEKAVTRAGWALLFITTAWTSWDLMPRYFDPQVSFPLELSDWLRFITAYALITRSGWAISTAYYCGLTLNVQAILTPDCDYRSVPALEFSMYWFLHIAVLLGPILLVWGEGYRPTWKGFGAAYGITGLWAAVAMSVNFLIGSNYGYLNGAPPGPSALDFMGPWPTYIFVGMGLLAFAWAVLMTWPWYLLGENKGSGSGISGKPQGGGTVVRKIRESKTYAMVRSALTRRDEDSGHTAAAMPRPKTSAGTRRNAKIFASVAVASLAAATLVDVARKPKA